jgi:hypothetical protein
MTVQDLCHLLSPTSAINQQAIQLYLHIFCSQFQTTLLDTGFFTQLHQGGWSRVHSWFLPKNPPVPAGGNAPFYLENHQSISHVVLITVIG